MTIKEMRDNARACMINCKVCRECNGEACRAVMPGPGGKGTGDGFVRSYKKVQEVKLNMDTIYDACEIDTSMEMFGHTFKYPFFSAPLASATSQYGAKYNDETFGRAVAKGTRAAGIMALLPDGVDPMFQLSCTIGREMGGFAVPSIKPWPIEVMIEKAHMAKEAGCIAVFTDLDAAGLSLVQNGPVKVMPHGIKDIEKLALEAGVPVVVKGVMTVAGARKCLEAGAYGIVVSSHGGRVQDQVPAPIEVLPEIVDAVGGKMKIFVDGALRSGADVFKVLAMGADCALIGRPYAVAVYGGDAEGVELYTNSIGAQIREAMMMTGCPSVKDINLTKVRIPKDF
ncbi:4-hydroxymandelate oxidase [bioreactor metagenome]|uniref:4-hydroxymandelate oxidase n=1 Tax=bioreactor metagenome TaxID=1076179 RepID=A0A644WYP0_9ZZZZ